MKVKEKLRVLCLEVVKELLEESEANLKEAEAVRDKISDNLKKAQKVVDGYRSNRAVLQPMIDLLEGKEDDENT